MKKPSRSFSLRRLLALLLVFGTAGTVRPVRADDLVRQVQEELRKRNLYFGDVDGTLSTPTTAALRRYQQRKGFPSTGEPDAVTLHSLMILVPSTLTAAAANSPPATPGLPGGGPLAGLAGGTHPWPDITVLRSDEGRPQDAAPEDDNHGNPPGPSRPPHTPAAATRQRLTNDDVRAFVARYLVAGQTNDPPTELAFFGDRVEYFGDGLRDRRYIEHDINRYDHRWPERHFTILEPFTVSLSPDGDPDKTVVSFRLQFSNKGARYLVQGKTDNTWTLTGTLPLELRIVSIKEQRVRE